MTSAILIIDDNPWVRRGIGRVLRTLLAQRGLEVREASNGLEALKLLKEFTPVLIICDLEMPVMGGEEFLRARPEGQTTIPLILNSAREDISQIAESFGVSFSFKEEPKMLRTLVESLLP